MADKQKEYEKKGISFGKNGKPTKSSMDKVFEKDKELFIDLQNDYFTTRGTMGEGKIDIKSMMNRVKEKMKGSKK